MTGGMKQPVIKTDAAEAIRQNFYILAVENGVSGAIEAEIRCTHFHVQFVQVVAEISSQLPGLGPAFGGQELALLKIVGQSGEIVFEIPRFDLFKMKFTAHLTQKPAVFRIGFLRQKIKPGKDLLRLRARTAKHEDGKNGVGMAESELVAHADGLVDAAAIEGGDLRASPPGLLANPAVRIARNQIAQLGACELLASGLVAEIAFLASDGFLEGQEFCVRGDLGENGFVEEKLAAALQ
jgi:hypothetical protein